jgi:hypothetical protein
MSSLDYIVVCKAKICKLSFSQLGGSLKRSLGMVSFVLTIPKAYGFEAATLPGYQFKFDRRIGIM